MCIRDRVYTEKKEAGAALIDMCRSAKQPKMCIRDRSTQVVALEFSSSGSISLISRWSNASFLPSLVIFSILSMFGCTFLSLTASALSASCLLYTSSITTKNNGI